MKSVTTKETVIVTKGADSLYLQLRAENYELLQKLKDYDLRQREYEELHVKFIELEHKMKMMESEKFKASMQMQSSEVEVHKKFSVMEESVKKSEEIIFSKQAQLVEYDRELIRAREIINERNREIIRLRALLDEGSVSIQRFSEEKLMMERDMNMAIDAKKSMQLELERIIAINERLTKANKELIERDREYSLESSKYTKVVEEYTHEIDMFKYQLEQKSRELEIAIESRKAIQLEIEKYSSNAAKFQEEVYKLTRITKEYEEERIILNKRISETMTILSVKDEELRTTSMNLRAAEERVMTFTSSHSRFEHEYEIIKHALEVREEELARLRKMRDEEASRRVSSETEFKKMESVIATKEMEIKQVRTELESVMMIKQQIIEERTMLISEFEALKEHVKVLETQNMTVSTVVNSISYIKNSINSLRSTRESESISTARSTLNTSKRRTARKSPVQ